MPSQAIWRALSKANSWKIDLHNDMLEETAVCSRDHLDLSPRLSCAEMHGKPRLKGIATRNKDVTSSLLTHFYACFCIPSVPFSFIFGSPCLLGCGFFAKRFQFCSFQPRDREHELFLAPRPGNSCIWCTGLACFALALHAFCSPAITAVAI